MTDILTDIRHAARHLAHTPSFTVATILTLSLAIAGNSAIFAVVHRVVLNPLPYPDSERLVQLEHGSGRLNLASGIGLTSGLYFQYRRAHTLAAVAVYRRGESTLAGRGEPVRVQSAQTTASLSAVLGVAPARGRWFSAEDERPGAAGVAVLSHGLWVRRFGADPAIVGQSITVDGAPAQVLGVMPPSFAFPDARIEVWLPTTIASSMGFNVPFRYVGVARLRGNATLADARSELNALIADLPHAYPGDVGALGAAGPGGLRSVAVPLKEATLGAVTRTLWVLLAAMALVLLVACANVANLFIVRSEARQREIAVRRALGAGGAGVARLFLLESGLLGISGGAIGLGLAWAAVHLLVANGPTALPRLNEVRLDAVAVLFTFAVAVVAGLAFGSIPLWHGAPVVQVLRDAGRANTASRTRHRVRQLLMASQVALGLVLLVAAALMLQSFQRLRAFDPGFDPTSTITFRIGLPERAYPTRDAASRAHQAILTRLAELPGVSAVSASTGLPLADACFGNTVLVEGRALPDGVTPPLARLCAVSGGYADAMRMRLLRGRMLTDDDVNHTRTNVVVNQAFAAAVFRGEDPIGRRVRSNAPPPAGALRDRTGVFAWNGAPPWLTIVGVVANTPFTTLGERTPPGVIYMPMSIASGADTPARAMLGPSVVAMSYVVRTAASPTALMPDIRRAVDAVDPGLALAQVRTLDDILRQGSSQMAFTMTLLVLAATIALVMALIGIYGVVSYIVAQRRGEIGVRLALGASPRAVVRLMVRQGAIVALAGLAVGTTAAFAGSRLLESLLYEVSPRDPRIFGAAGVALLAVCIVACWLPARRAALVNPVEALRAE